MTSLSAVEPQIDGRPVPDALYAAALLTLPDLWPARMAALLGQRRAGRHANVSQPALLFETLAPSAPRQSARAAWAIVASGHAADDPALRAVVRGADVEVLAATWAAAAARVDIDDLARAYARRRVAVDLLGTDTYPGQLAGDFEAPYALFRAGGRTDLDGVRVAVIGTRQCTPTGRGVAAEFATALSGTGVRVVSGLALGIDAVAHQAALAAHGAPPIGVVAGGFDRPYPARHDGLWREVMTAGALVSEWPLGTRSEGWRFPARNRIIAGLSDAVIVVESRDTGGSLITANEALDRGVPVLAVPGSVRNPAAAGTNQLIRDGAMPVCNVDEVLSALSLELPALGQTPPPSSRPTPTGTAGAVLAALDWDPTSFDAVLRRTGLDPAVVALDLANLEMDGWVGDAGGMWQRRRE